MYQKAYGIIETLAPLHVGASAGEETGNLNLIFRDQFTQTGIIPGSSIRGRFRADMRENQPDKVDHWYGKEAKILDLEEPKRQETTEALAKFEYASILWLPVYCPNQPVVWVSCPRWLKRYQRLSGLPKHDFEPYHYYSNQELEREILFFSLGFLPLQQRDKKLKEYIPDNLSELNTKENIFFLVKDQEIQIIHDMSLYRQSRVRLEEKQKKAKRGGFFDVEALPESTVLIFPFALKEIAAQQSNLQNFIKDAHLNQSKEMYFGGLESIGFGRTQVTLKQHQENK